MGKINVLSFAVANLIAAGEVVDRPASAIKELLENSIDAGADRVTVEIQNGGVTFMRVSDNGCGIEPDELPIAVRRHATSKIKDATDLEKIITLGFRGEALAAISAVADVRIISKTADAEMGAMIEVSCGDILGVSERGCSKGTTVIVENLFANVPARRKFLKRDVTEAMAVTANVEKIALSHPEVALKLISDGSVKLETGGDGKIESAIYSVFGKDFVKRMIKVDSEIEGIRVKGYIGRSDNVKGNRNHQNFFLNGRYVKSRTASAAIEQAFVSYIPPEKFPVCVLDIILNPAAVDVNVHPSKLEVKFSNEKAVFEAVYYTVRSALETNKDRPDFELSRVVPKPQSITPKTSGIKMSELTIPVEEAIRGESAQKRQMTIDGIGFGNTGPSMRSPIAPLEVKPQHEPITTKIQESKPHFITAEEYAEAYVSGLVIPKGTKLPDEDEDEPTDLSITEDKTESVICEPPTVQAPINVAPTVESQDPEEKQEEPEPMPIPHRVVGELFNCYVVVELEDKFLLVDKHAAHERINFEKLKAGMKKNERPSQLLMLPIDVMLTSDEVHTIAEYRSEIEALGFEFSTARNTVSVTAIPGGISADGVNDMLATMADRLKNGTGNAELTRDILFEKALYQASCKASIKGGREYPPEYVEWLVAEMMKIPDITVCPHGRPVAMEISRKNLERQFGRT
jgi:DNA mismatch repair protein MutL